MERGEELTFIQKRFLVQRLACFDTPTVAAKAFKEEYGVELKRNRVSYYDPTTKMGAALAEDFKKLFFETRKQFLEDLESIPIANKAVRLRRLDRMAASRTRDTSSDLSHEAFREPLSELSSKSPRTLGRAKATYIAETRKRARFRRRPRTAGRNRRGQTNSPPSPTYVVRIVKRQANVGFSSAQILRVHIGDTQHPILAIG